MENQNIKRDQPSIIIFTDEDDDGAKIVSMEEKEHQTIMSPEPEHIMPFIQGGDKEESLRVGRRKTTQRKSSSRSVESRGSSRKSGRKGKKISSASDRTNKRLDSEMGLQDGATESMESEEEGGGGGRSEEAMESDGRSEGSMESDGRMGRSMGSNKRSIGSKGRSGSGRSGGPIGGGGRSGGPIGGGGRSGGSMERDERPEGSMGSDGRSGGSMGSDGRSGGSMGSDGRSGGSMGSDGRSGGSMGSDGRSGGSMGRSGGPIGGGGRSSGYRAHTSLESSDTIESTASICASTPYLEALDSPVMGTDGDGVVRVAETKPKRTGSKAGKVVIHQEPLRITTHLYYPDLAPQIREYVLAYLEKRPEYPKTDIDSEKRSVSKIVKEYLQEKDIQGMFQMMISSLMCQQPDRPIDFLIDMVREMAQQTSNEMKGKKVLHQPHTNPADEKRAAHNICKQKQKTSQHNVSDSRLSQERRILFNEDQYDESDEISLQSLRVNATAAPPPSIATVTSDDFSHQSRLASILHRSSYSNLEHAQNFEEAGGWPTFGDPNYWEPK